MPQSKRFLCALILTTATFGNLAVSAGADRDYREQQLKFARAYDSANYQAALEAAEKLHEMRPAEIAHIYNVACMNCLLGNKDKAYRWLDKLVDAGFKDADGLLDDYDFRTMRAEPRFRALVRQIRGEKVADDRPAPQTEKRQKKRDDAQDAKPKREIKKLDSKNEADDARLSGPEMQRLGREIGELTQQLIETAPGNPKKALKIAKKAYQNARKIEASLKTISPEAAEQIHPAVSLTSYNMACMQSLAGNKDAAFEYLDIAHQYGGLQGSLLEQMSGDGDLDNLRDDRRYRDLVKKLGGTVNERAAAPSASSDAGEFKEKLPDVPEMSPRDRFGKIGTLTQDLIATATRGEHEAALDISLRALAHSKILYDMAKDHEEYGPQIRQQWTLTNYNAACMYSLTKNKAAALFYLDRSVGDASYFPGDFIQQIKRDSDLDYIRDTDAFKRIFKRAQKAADGDATASDSASAFKENLPEVDKDISLEERSQRVNQLIQQAFEASQNKETEKGLKYASEAVAHVQLVYNDLKDDDRLGDRARGLAALTDYNLACFYSLKNNKEGALFYLRRAAENRDHFPSDFATQLKTDSDMDNIRDTAGFKAILGGGDKPEAAASDATGADETVEFEWKITLPPNHDSNKDAPLVVVLHHYHGNMNRTIERWQTATAEMGAILLTPQGTVKLGDGMYHWGRDLDLVERNVMMAINKVMDEHKIDQRRIVLGGFSQGGWATWAIALRNPEAFCGIIPVCGSVRVEGDDAFKRDGLEKMRVWVMLGEDENSRVIDSNKDAAAKLSERGAKVKLNMYEGVGHGYPTERDEELTRALKFVMER